MIAALLLALAFRKREFPVGSVLCILIFNFFISLLLFFSHALHPRPVRNIQEESEGQEMKFPGAEGFAVVSCEPAAAHGYGKSWLPLHTPYSKYQLSTPSCFYLHGVNALTDTRCCFA